MFFASKRFKRNFLCGLKKAVEGDTKNYVGEVMIQEMHSERVDVFHPSIAILNRKLT